jgi:hypothetical protein
MRSRQSMVQKYSNMSRKGEQKGNNKTGLETIKHGAQKHGHIKGRTALTRTGCPDERM